MESKLTVFSRIVYGILMLQGLVATEVQLGFNNSSWREREERGFLSLWSKETEETLCTANNVQGICTSSSTCRKYGGTRMGRCDGGTCCSVQVTCQANTPCDVRVSGSRVSVPTTAGMYTIRLNRPKGVEQVHLEFGNSALAPPTVAPRAGNCMTEFLQVTGSPTLIGGTLRVCGSLVDQNMYLAYGNANSLTITLQRANNAAGGQVDFLVSYVSRKARTVPLECLQAYNSGQTVRSFGYPTQLNNQMYTVCFLTDAGTMGTTVSLTPCDNGAADSFGIVGDTQLASQGYQIQLTNQAVPPNNPFNLIGDIAPCTGDWIQLFGARQLCDILFPQMYSSTFRPFALAVNFNADERNRIGGYSFDIPNPADPSSCFTPAPPAGQPVQDPEMALFLNNNMLCYQLCMAVNNGMGNPTSCTCRERTEDQIRMQPGLANPEGAVGTCRDVFGRLRGDNGNQGFCLNVNVG